ncbi:phosphoadenylyl-sulfate reductase [Rickettsiales bacterium]|nr:phosphoadenylyl-sulfate reductase [Rickettsiales bacterium]
MNFDKYTKLEGRDLLESVVKDNPGKVALMSAFNPEDVILSYWLSEFAPSTPILFLDTKKHFPETLRYKDAIVKQLGLKDVRVFEPKEELINNIDKDGELWKYQVNRCCWLRKVEPIERGIKEGGFNILITGRRIEQTPERTDMKFIEEDSEKGQIKINPLMNWTRDERDDYMKEHNLAHHPLYDLGYLSIGCAPCTTPIFAGENERAGRWRHTKTGEDKGKTECGLHVSEE